MKKTYSTTTSNGNDNRESRKMKTFDTVVFVIETDEEDPKAVAVAGNLPIIVGDGFRVRAVATKRNPFTDYGSLSSFLSK